MLKFTILRDGGQAPTQAYGHAIGWDLYSADDVTIAPGDIVGVGTGIAIEFVPAAGAIIGTRSGMAKKGIDTRGGWIDGDYRGEIIVITKNDSAEPYTIHRGDKIAQMAKQPLARDQVKQVKKLSETKRGAKGFGSSGR